MRKVEYRLRWVRGGLGLGADRRLRIPARYEPRDRPFSSNSTGASGRRGLRAAITATLC